jgi:hypothetical protein
MNPDIDYNLGGFFANGVIVQSREGVIRVFFSDHPLFCKNLFAEEDKIELPIGLSLVEEIRPSEKEWQAFIESLKITDNWKESYDSNICDGVQWELKVYYKFPEGRRKIKKVYGSNNYPKDFKVFGKAIFKLIRYEELKNPDKFNFWSDADNIILDT